MEETKEKIIALFKNKGSEISTGELLNYVYGSKTNKDTNNADSKRESAQMHRKLLYHINKLVENGILRFSRHGEKGHKFFALDIGENEEITEFSSKYKRKLTVSKPLMPLMPIETYEHQGIINKFETESWIDRLNSVVIMCKKVDSIDKLNALFESAISVINDCICLENFEDIINKNKKEDVIKLIEKINSECKDYGKQVSCTIDISKINKGNFLEILQKAASNETNKVMFIYSLDAHDVQEQFAILNEILVAYMKKKKLIYFKNKRATNSLQFVGSAGPYSILEKEWENKKDCLSFACAQSSLIVDVEKFYSVYGLDTEKFAQLMLNVSKSFLSANTLQRRKSKDYFKSIISLDKTNEKEFLELSRNYIRFWNYGLLQPGIDQKLVLNMINEAKKRIDEFSMAEETIYKSCGMPTRFKIALSCAFKEANEKLSSAKYKKLEITGLEDLYKPKIRKDIMEKEIASSVLNGGNDITFHRKGNFDSQEIMRELSIIINAYKMPLFSFNFEGSGDAKILSYL